MRKSRCLCGRPLEYQELHSLVMAQHALASHITFQSCRKGDLSLVPQMIKIQQVHELEHELGSDTSDALYRCQAKGKMNSLSHQKHSSTHWKYTAITFSNSLGVFYNEILERKKKQIVSRSPKP